MTNLMQTVEIELKAATENLYKRFPELVAISVSSKIDKSFNVEIATPEGRQANNRFALPRKA